MENKVLKLGFIEPIIREVRTSIEFMYKVKLNRENLSLGGFSPTGLSKLCAMHVNSEITRYLIKTGNYMGIENRIVDCEVKHIPAIPSKLWPISHWIIEVSDHQRKIYIDPLTSVLLQIDANAPDVYISEGFPNYLSPFRNRRYNRSDFFHYIEYKLKGRFYDWIGKTFHLR